MGEALTLGGLYPPVLKWPLMHCSASALVLYKCSVLTGL